MKKSIDIFIDEFIDVFIDFLRKYIESKKKRPTN